MCPAPENWTFSQSFEVSGMHLPCIRQPLSFWICDYVIFLKYVRKALLTYCMSQSVYLMMTILDLIWFFSKESTLQTKVRYYWIIHLILLDFVPEALEQLLDVINIDFNAFLYCTGQGELLVKQAGGTECIYPLLQAGQFYFTAEPSYCLGGLKLNITALPLWGSPTSISFPPNNI